ncbi:MAG: hypothetical protein IJV14_00540 [Lachnospiraceae bacterium]|nr:hypothetical protein [Lachnospiraceae bacterium]
MGSNKPEDLAAKWMERFEEKTEIHLSDEEECVLYEMRIVPVGEAVV